MLGGSLFSVLHRIFEEKLTEFLEKRRGRENMIDIKEYGLQFTIALAHWMLSKLHVYSWANIYLNILNKYIVAPE